MNPEPSFPSSGRSVDFGRTAEDYARWRKGFPRSFFERVAGLGIGRPGQRLLDLGTGSVARGFAELGCAVTALDISGELLEQAKDLDREAGIEIRYFEARAEETGLPAAGFEVVTAGQSWNWFEEAKVLPEVLRLLVPAGRLCIAHFDWLPLEGNLVEATETLILKHNPSWSPAGGDGLHSSYLEPLARAGFGELSTFHFEEAVPYSPEGWRARIRASAGIGASLPPAKVEAFDRELKRLLERRFPAQRLELPHRVWALVGRRP